MSIEIGRNAITPGVCWGDYEQINAVSITKLKSMARSPQHFICEREKPKESRPMTLGTAAHCAVLEPERFDVDYVAWGKKTKRGKAAPRCGATWAAFLEDHKKKTIITANDYNLALKMQGAIRSNAAAIKYLRSGTPEVVMRWTAFGRECKARADWIIIIDGLPVLVGIKTARDCREREFGRDSAKYEYPMQWAFYYDGYKSITGISPKVVEIVVENKAPHAVSVYVIDDVILSAGFDKYSDLLIKLEECETSNAWPGPSQGEQVLRLPSYYYGIEELESISYVK